MATEKQDKPSIIIDCQIFQTFSWHRGMGKHSIELLKELLIRPELQNKMVYLLFNSNGDKNAEAQKMLREIRTDVQFLQADLELPEEPRSRLSVQPKRLKNKQTLTRLINEHFAPESKPLFFILSLYLDEVCSVFPDNEFLSDKVLLYYDAIPYLYHERYGKFPAFFEHYYLPHTASVFEATKVLTISRTVANELRLYLGIPETKIFNVDGAAIPFGPIKPVQPKGVHYKKDKFILMPSGQEIRKNNHRGVEAFERFIQQTGKDYKLVITSRFDEDGRKDLRALSDNVVFSGNIDPAELLWLYQNCRFVFFPSEYEGLGLPPLEALDQDKLVACSDIPVFREKTQDAYFFFDPLDVDAITKGLVATDAAVAAGPNKAAYRELREKYTWARSAKEVAAAFEAEVELPIVTKKKIAIFGPDPTGFSAIGKDIADMHGWISTFFDVTYYFEHGPSHRVLRPNIMKYAAPCLEAKDFTATDYEKFDAVIYHIGNSEYHLHSFRAALTFPGYVILHDASLRGLFNDLTQLGYITGQRVEAEESLERSIVPQSEKRKEGFLHASLVNNQFGVFVHSAFTKKVVSDRLLNKQIAVKELALPFEVPIFTDILPRATKKKQVHIAFAGIIAKIKGIDLLEDIALSEEFKDCHINIFGFSAEETDQLRRLREMPNVTVRTNPTDFEFQNLLAASDISVNVRLSHNGETSGSTLSHMRYGGVPVVRDFGWFSELPDNAVVKVEGPETVVRDLRELLNDSDRVKALGDEALVYMREKHSQRVYVEGLYRLLDQRPS